MESKGNIVIGVMFFVIAISFLLITVSPVKDFVNDMRNADGLDCDNTTIPASQYLSCLQTDLIVPLYVFSVIAAGIGAIAFNKIVAS